MTDEQQQVFYHNMVEATRKINEGYRRIGEMRKEYGVKPGESLFEAMGIDAPWLEHPDR